MNEMRGTFSNGTLTSGDAVVVAMGGAPIPATITASPVAGDTVTVSYSTDKGSSYTVWPQGTAGAVTAKTRDVLQSGVTHIKFQRTAGAGITSTFEIT